MKTLAICQARMGSTRVPGKVMRNLRGIPVYRWVYNAARDAIGVDEAIVATSLLPADDVIANHCFESRISFFRGSESDVLGRFYLAAKEKKADVILRLTCDCPFLDPKVIAEVVALRAATDADYASNVSPPTYPDGLDVEVFTFAALEAAYTEATRPSDRDTVTQWISRNRTRFPAVNATCPVPGLAKERWVLDTEDDWNFVSALAEHVSSGDTSYTKILRVLDAHPEIRKLNEKGVRNERFTEGLTREDLGYRSFDASSEQLDRALRTVPFGAQTFSKSYLQFPAGRCPLYASHADGGFIYDIDGNDYVDLVSAILPVVLGYRDPDVDRAIRQQLDNGISFSLATKLEAELSELMCSIIPCAEMVKFGKSGTDVTSAAIRLARAYTGRNQVLLSGYHGWADWSMAATDRDRGIPQWVKDLTTRIPYGDIKAASEVFARYTGDVAAVIVEPNDDPDYLRAIVHMAHANNAVVIFDEIITGFRYSMGGAQKHFGITPDLATFGKAMANGMPLSALVGNRDIMKLMQPPNNIFYSGTMFGETLSLAASIATIKKMQEQNVIEHLWNMGAYMGGMAMGCISRTNLAGCIRISGQFPRMQISFHDYENGAADQYRTLFLESMAEHGVLIINSHNVSFAHRADHAHRVKSAYDATCDLIRCMIDNDAVVDVENVVTAAPLRASA